MCEGKKNITPFKYSKIEVFLRLHITDCFKETVIKIL